MSANASVLEKYVLALRCLNAARNIAPQHPVVHQQTIALRQSLGSVLGSLPPKVQEVLKNEFTAISPSADLRKLNLEFRTQNSLNALHALAALRVDRLLGADKAKCQQAAVDIVKQHETTLEDAQVVLDALKEWDAEPGPLKSVARERWPEASVFG